MCQKVRYKATQTAWTESIPCSSVWGGASRYHEEKVSLCLYTVCACVCV